MGQGFDPLCAETGLHMPLIFPTARLLFFGHCTAPSELREVMYPCQVKILAG